MNPFRRLGLDPSADEREIRRAYARLLKQTRPDDDAAGFQQLHEAYQACLAQAQRRRPAAVRIDGDVVAAPVEVEVEVEAEAEAEVEVEVEVEVENDDVDEFGYDDYDYDEEDADEPWQPVAGAEAFDVHAFLDELVRRADYGPAPLRQWLQSHEALYSLRLKDAIAMPALQAVVRDPDAAREPICAVVMQFFAIDPLSWQARNLLDSMNAQRLRRDAESAFARGVLPAVAGERRWIDDVIDRELSRPPHRVRQAFLLLWPGAPTQVATRILAIDAWAGGVARERIPPATRQRFLALADRSRFIWQRWLLTLARAVFWYGLVLLLIVGTGKRPLDAGDGLLVLGATGFFIAWQGLRAAILQVKYWIARHAGQRDPIHRGGVLLAALVSLGLGTREPGFGIVASYSIAVMLAGLVAGEKRVGSGLLVLAFLIASSFALSARGIDVPGLPPGLSGAVAAPLLMLGWDAWRNRRRRLPLAAVRDEEKSLWPLVAGTGALTLALLALL